MAKLAILPSKLVLCMHATAQIGIKGDIKAGEW